MTARRIKSTIVRSSTIQFLKQFQLGNKYLNTKLEVKRIEIKVRMLNLYEVIQEIRMAPMSEGLIVN